MSNLHVVHEHLSDDTKAKSGTLASLLVCGVNWDDHRFSKGEPDPDHVGYELSAAKGYAIQPSNRQTQYVVVCFVMLADIVINFLSRSVTGARWQMLR